MAETATPAAVTTPAETPATPTPTPTPAPDDTGAWKERFEKLRDERQADKAKSAEMNTELESLRGMRGDFEKFQKERAEAKENKMKEEGNFKGLLEKQKSESATRETKLLTALEQERIENAILAASADAVAPMDVVFALRPFFSLDPEGLKPVVNTDALKGLKIDAYTDDIDPKNVKQIVADYLKARPHLQKAVTPGGGGGTQDGALPVGYVRGQTNEIPSDPAERKKFIEQLTKVAKSQAGM